MARAVHMILAILALASLARADALDLHRLPAETVWFVHLDVESAGKSLLGQGVREFLLSQPEPRALVEKVRAKIGVDLSRDVQSILVYGVNYAPDRGVIVVRGKMDRARLVALVTALPDFRSDESSGHKLYYWTEVHPGKDETAPPRHNVAAFFGDDLLILSADEASVVKEVAVLEGKSPALAKDSPLAVESTPGTIFHAGLSELSAINGVSPIIRQCESGSVMVGEHQGEAFVRGQVMTRTAETGEQVASLLKGARALGQLQAAEDQDVQALLKPVNITVQDRHVEVSWSFPAADLLRIAKMELIRRAVAVPTGRKP